MSGARKLELDLRRSWRYLSTKELFCGTRSPRTDRVGTDARGRKQAGEEGGRGTRERGAAALKREGGIEGEGGRRAHILHALH